MPLTLDLLFRQIGIAPASVHLVRHQHKPLGSRGTPYDLWVRNRSDFELYQAIQRRKIFRIENYVASFVVPPTGETLFVGLYQVKAEGTTSSDFVDPLSGGNVGGFRLYELVADPRINEYAG